MFNGLSCRTRLHVAVRALLKQEPCSVCHRWFHRRDRYCRTCGTPLQDRTGEALVEEYTRALRRLRLFEWSPAVPTREYSARLALAALVEAAEVVVANGHQPERVAYLAGRIAEGQLYDELKWSKRPAEDPAPDGDSEGRGLGVRCE